MRLSRLFLCMAFAAGCGGQGKPSPAPHNTSAGQAAVGASDALALIDRFAAALEHDDASTLAGLVDPSGGVRVWYTPGVAPAIAAHITASGGPPSRQLAPTDPDGPPRPDDPKAWAAHIRGALAVVDVEPANPDDPKYHDDCATNQGPTRALLVRQPPPSPESWPYFAEDGKVDRDLTEVVYRLSFGAALGVWVVRHDGRLYISDLFTADACSA